MAALACFLAATLAGPIDGLASGKAPGTILSPANSDDRKDVAAVAGVPIIIGLDADMSKGAAQGGEAIRRGVVLAIDEINAGGGVLGRPLKLVVKDHRGNPARGVDNIKAFASMEELVAVVGGVHTPVALAELEVIHKHKIIYLGPWAAGTPIVDNAFDPNFVFRVSVRDEYAGGFLVNEARKRGFSKLGLLLWRTGWGRSNEKAMTNALAAIGLQPAAIQWFNTGQKDLSKEISALEARGADVVMLVSNPVEGQAAVRDMAMRPSNRRLPIISHWGITGGHFYKSAAEWIRQIDLSFLQTFSFFDPPFPKRAALLLDSYCLRFGGCKSKADARSPVGIAHAYDLVKLLSRAIEKAGSIDRTHVRAAMERLGEYQGIMRNYDPPFTRNRHDALNQADFKMCRFGVDGAIEPIAAE
jgi:branched-chain amino acid transport system substrate-binding protein